MRKLYELLGRSEPIPGLFGIEIEAEGVKMKAVNAGFWRSEDDGSLRGRYPDTRIEWVTNGPVALKDVKPALEQLAEAQKGAKLNFSFRTSVHVHVNMHELTHPQVLNVIYTYLLLEEPLLTYCGEQRKGNRFCLRLQDAEGLMDDLKKVFIGGEGALFGINPNGIRYASINLEALKKYGSMEFRGMRGNLDVNIISTWVEILNKIRDYAMDMEDVEAIHAEFRDLGANAFMKKVMGKYAKVLGDDFERELNLSYSLSLDLPYTYKRYKELPKVEWKPKDYKLRGGEAILRWDAQAAVNPVRPIDPELLAGPFPDIVPGMAFEQWEAQRKQMIEVKRQELLAEIRAAANMLQAAPIVKPRRKPAPQLIVIDELENI